jgi:hypothetical protein
LQFGDPFGDILKGLIIGEIKNDQCSYCSIIVGLGDSSESLLSGCIPDLTSDVNIVDFDNFRGELYANGWFFV